MKNICNLEMGDLKGGYVFRIRKTQADNILLLNNFVLHLKNAFQRAYFFK